MSINKSISLIVATRTIMTICKSQSLSSISEPQILADRTIIESKQCWELDYIDFVRICSRMYSCVIWYVCLASCFKGGFLLLFGTQDGASGCASERIRTRRISPSCTQYVLFVIDPRCSIIIFGLYSLHSGNSKSFSCLTCKNRIKDNVPWFVGMRKCLENENETIGRKDDEIQV